jgi:hypothetical protein
VFLVLISAGVPRRKVIDAFSRGDIGASIYSKLYLPEDDGPLIHQMFDKLRGLHTIWYRTYFP